MKLIPQQVEILKAELSKLRQRKQELIDSKSNTYAICHENQTGDNDRELIDSIATLNVRMNKIQRILDNAEVVEPRTDGKIGIHQMKSIQNRRAVQWLPLQFQLLPHLRPILHLLWTVYGINDGYDFFSCQLTANCDHKLPIIECGSHCVQIG